MDKKKHHCIINLPNVFAFVRMKFIVMKICGGRSSTTCFRHRAIMKNHLRCL